MPHTPNHALHYSPLRCSSGYTIVEALLTVAIIGMLLAMAMPSLKSVTIASEETAAHSALRQAAVAVVGYATDHRASFPYLVPEGTYNVTTFANHDVPPNSVDYFFDQTRYWPSVVMPWFSSNPRIGAHHAFREVDLAGRPVQFTRFWMTSTAFAAPAYWLTSDIPEDSSLLRGTRLAEMRYPARKGLLMDVASGAFHPSQAFSKHPTQHHALIATGDGAVGSYPWMPPAEFVSRPGAPPWPVMSTKGGIAAHDFPTSY